MSDFILGNEKVRHHLKESIIKNTISHAYILAGDKGVGKSKIAKEFAMDLYVREIIPDVGNARHVGNFWQMHIRIFSIWMQRARTALESKELEKI